MNELPVINNNVLNVNLSANSSDFDHESIIFQALVNEGKFIKVLNSRRAELSFNEKDLRDAARKEVAAIMSAEEGVSTVDTKISKVRNREHAKNTRLRKKLYVEKLKALVDRMKTQRDLEIEERRALCQRITDTQTIRKNVVRLMLNNRAVNDQDRETWASLLEECFEITLPLTFYRSFRKGEVVGGRRVVRGIDGMMADAASLAVLVESIGQGSKEWSKAVARGQGCSVQCVALDEDQLAAGDVVVSRFSAHTDGWERVGAKCGVQLQGMVRCQFGRTSNKMIAAEMVFDVMGVFQQLQMASPVPRQFNFLVQKAVQGVQCVVSSDTLAVLEQSAAWTALCAPLYASESVCRNDQLTDDTLLLRQLRPVDFHQENVTGLLRRATSGRAGSTVFLAHPHCKDRDVLRAFHIKMEPFCTEDAPSGRVAAVLVELVSLSLSEEEAALLRSQKKESVSDSLHTISCNSSNAVVNGDSDRDECEERNESSSSEATHCKRQNHVQAAQDSDQFPATAFKRQRCAE